MTRKVFSKVERARVFNKFDGKCAYCGCRLELNRFDVDHLHPYFLSHHEPDLDPHRFENLMPACKKCNRFKHSFKLESYRTELRLQVLRLKENAKFNRALTFGQIKITESPIVFYFEKS